MRICVIGKFPPIQGGVSMRTYWTAHALAKRGHEVHVVTNAKEATPPFRMHMRDEDWQRCAASYGAEQISIGAFGHVERWLAPERANPCVIEDAHHVVVAARDAHDAERAARHLNHTFDNELHQVPYAPQRI